MNTTTVYIPTPVSETTGAKEGYWYYAMNPNKEIFPSMLRFVNGEFENINTLRVAFWIKIIEVTTDSPVQKLLRFMNHNWTAEEIEKDGYLKYFMREIQSVLPEDLARSAHISNLESIRDKQLLDIAGLAKEISDLKGGRERLVSDAWDAALTWSEFSGSPADSLVPDKETYLKSLNTKS